MIDDNKNMESKMKMKLVQFLRDEEGLTIVEYAVAAAMISAAVIASFTLLGVNINAVIAGLAAAIGLIPPAA